MGAILAEQDDIWSGKRNFSEERLAELRETARKAIDASLELADGMETA